MFEEIFSVIQLKSVKLSRYSMFIFMNNNLINHVTLGCNLSFYQTGFQKWTSMDKYFIFSQSD